MPWPRRVAIGAACLGALVSAAFAFGRPPVVTLPGWSERPTQRVLDVAREYGVRHGDFRLTCYVAPEGVVRDCDVQAEGPVERTSDRPYLAGAMKNAMSNARMWPTTFDGIPLPAQVTIDVQVSSTGDDLTVEIAEPQCLQCINQDGDQAVEFDAPERVLTLPAEAVRRGVREGWVLLRCRVDVPLVLSECSIWYETPIGAGFGREALKAVDEGRVSASRTQGPVALIVYFDANAPLT